MPIDQSLRILLSTLDAIDRGETFYRTNDARAALRQVVDRLVAKDLTDAEALALLRGGLCG